MAKTKKINKDKQKSAVVKNRPKKSVSRASSRTGNPFLQEDQLTTWLELDKDFKASKNLSLKKFIQSHGSKPAWQVKLYSWFNLSKTAFMKHAAAYSVLVVFLLGGVTASAFELFAPEDYKPSTYFNPARNMVEPETEEPEEIEASPLLPSDQEGVLVIPDCDLALKIRKEILPLSFNLVDQTNANQQRLGTEDSVLDKAISLNYTDESGQERFLFLMCIDTRTISFVDDEEGNEQLKEVTGVTKFEDLTPLNQACNGLYLTEASCDKVDFIQQGDTLGQDKAYLFGTRRRAFLIQTNVLDISSYTTQLQFDSLAPSQSTLDYDSLLLASKNQKDNKPKGPAKALESSETHQVAVSRDCDLAIKFKSDIFTLSNQISYPVAMDVGCKRLDQGTTQRGILDSVSRRGFTPVPVPAKEVDFLEDSTANLVGEVYVSNQILRDETGNPNLYDATNLIFFYNDVAYEFNFFYDEPSQLFNYNFEDLFIQFDSLAPSNGTISLDTQQGAGSQEGLTSYTNQFYPDLELVYDDSWDFETTTADSIYPELLVRRLFLRRNDSFLEVIIQPYQEYSCDSDSFGNYEPVSTFFESLERYVFTDGEYRYTWSSGDFDASCPRTFLLPLQSNINAADIPSYQAMYPNDPQVISLVEVRMVSDNLEDIADLDDIVRRSVLTSGGL
jgi:hypothetical protein